jgi:ApaG protein
MGTIPMATKTKSPNSDTVTDGIRIHASAQFLPDESDPDAPFYLFVYRIVIRNTGHRRAKLLSRHWIIKDSNNERHDVEGPGVVGEFPDLGPGESFQYVSSCPLRTHWGTMEGSYLFEREDGSQFQVKIGRFFLAPNTEPISALQN